VSLLIKRSYDIVQSGGKGDADDKLYFLGIDLESRPEWGPHLPTTVARNELT